MARSRYIFVGIFIGGIVLIFIFLIMFSLWGITRQKQDFSILPAGDRIAIVEIEGVITESENAIRQLRKYDEDKNIPAIVVRIDSPGGAAAPAEEIYEYILKVRENGTYVVASLSSVAASGGYLIASACDSIVSNKGTLVGSIGTIMSFMVFEGLMDKVGVQLEIVKSGDLKDVGNYSREMTQKEREMLQAAINDAHNQFILAVANGRNMEIMTVEEVADGSIFTGNQALPLGLVDKIGGLDEAIALAGMMTGLGENPKTIKEIERKPTFFEYVMSSLLPDFDLNACNKVGPKLEYIFK